MQRKKNNCMFCGLEKNYNSHLLSMVRTSLQIWGVMMCREEMWSSESFMGGSIRLRQSVRETRERTKVTKHKHGACLLTNRLALDRNKVSRNKPNVLAPTGRVLSLEPEWTGLEVATGLHVNAFSKSALNSWYVLLRLKLFNVDKRYGMIHYLGIVVQ